MVELITDRLIIIPCSLDMAKSLIFHRDELIIRSPISIPKTWPSPKIQSYLPFYVEKLEKDQSEFGWGMWIMIEHNERKIIGSCSFKGKPNNSGTVELAYDVVEECQGKGYGFEAANSLVNWALSKEEVHCITAECDNSNAPSISILTKIGMKCIKREGNFLWWELRKV